MPTPFLSLAPQVPRVVDIPYAANALPCVDCTDCDTTDVTDHTDIPDCGLELPVVTVQPSNADNPPPSTVNFSVTSTGDALEYQWQGNLTGNPDDWVNIVEGAPYTGTNTTTMTITGVIPNASPIYYRCVVSNECGVAISDSATLYGIFPA